jgi:hypothetical protein
MDVLTSERALEFVRDRGGHVWIWLDVRRCCSGTVSYLGAACAEPADRRGGVPRSFRPIVVSDVTMHVSLGVRRPPEELHVDVRGRFRPRIEAYWNGCIFIDDRGSVSRAAPSDGAGATTPA